MWPPFGDPTPAVPLPAPSGPPRIVSVNVSRGGVPKRPVSQAWVGPQGLEGDVQRDRRHHGGPDRAVCLLALELIEALRAEGHPIEPGSAGENLTVAGVDWRELVPGTVIEVGGAQLEIASYTVPCKTIKGSFAAGEFTRLSNQLHPGWSRLYARVIRQGVVHSGDHITLGTGNPDSGAN